MNAQKITPLSPLLLRFYVRCFSYPYAELQYELQHLFRVMENTDILPEESEQLEIILNIINQYQGQDIKFLREDFVLTFTNAYPDQPYCPLLASDFLSRLNITYDPEPLLDLFMESGLSVSADESFDTIINYLEYLSLLFEQYLAQEIDLITVKEFANLHILNWIPYFCNQVEQVSNLALYKEVAIGLKQFLQGLAL